MTKTYIKKTARIWRRTDIQKELSVKSFREFLKITVFYNKQTTYIQEEEEEIKKYNILYPKLARKDPLSTLKTLCLNIW